MSSRKLKSAENKIVFQKSALSSSVLDYYYKFGQNRDLEKYLRVRKQSCSKSSSDGSLHNFEKTQSSGSADRIGKSLENLKLSQVGSGSRMDETNKSEKSTKTVSSDENSKAKKNQSTSNTSANKSHEPSERIKIHKKEARKLDKKSKSYNFNMESSIEISLPPSCSMPILTFPSYTSHLTEQSIAKVELETNQTQTDAITEVKSVATECSEPPLVPVKPSGLSLVDETPEADMENVLATSPASSIASAKVRLEWDSLADVGYNKVIELNPQTNNNLSSYEKSVLTKFFAKRGLNFDDNLVIFATPDKGSSNLNKKQTTDATSSKVPDSKRSHSTKVSSDSIGSSTRETSKTGQLSPRTNKHLWEKALMKYRQKYGKSKNLSSTIATDSIEQSSLSSPQFHSTPLPISEISVSKGAIPKISKISRTIEEKSCQTSVVVEAKGVQMHGFSDHTTQTEEPSNETKRESSSENSSDAKSRLSLSEDKEFTSVTSFEFMNPNSYQNQQLSTKTPLTEIESKLIETSNYGQSEEIPHASPESSSSEGNFPLNNAADKENIPPIEDKENIPPAHVSIAAPTATVYAKEGHSAARNNFVTPDQETQNITEETILPEDLQRGVDLINCLVVSKNLDNAAKKKLIRKIIRRLLRTKGIEELQEFLKFDQTKEKCSSSSSSNTTAISQRQEKEISGITKLSVSNDASGKNTPVATVEASNTVSISMPVISDADKGDSRNQDANNATIRDWLEPLTHSEIEREKLKKRQKQLESNLLEHQKVAVEENERNIDIFSENMVKKFLEMEKQTHFNWIDREIEHLTNLRKFLIPESRSQTDNLRPKSSKPGTADPKLAFEDYLNIVKQRKDRNIYENYKRASENSSGSSSKLSTIPATTASAGVSLKSSSDQSDKCSTSSVNKRNLWIHKTTLEDSTLSISDNTEHSSVARKQSDRFLVRKSKALSKDAGTEVPDWNSHLNMQQLVKSRMKMQTPRSDRSIESYAATKRSEFNSRYIRAHGTLYNNNMNSLNDKDQPIYTKPYSTDGYSNDNRRASRQHTVDAHTSITASDGFLSSKSISIAVAENSTSNTTTHQYDTKISIGVQTTDTLTRTRTINPHLGEPEISTVRVNKLTINKQQQVRPKPLAYEITFKEKIISQDRQRKRTVDKYAGEEKDNNFYQNSSDHRKSSRSSSESSSRHGGRTYSEASHSTTTDNGYTLQEYLRRRRPDFYQSAEQRRRCVIELNDLRQERNEQRKNLFAVSNSNHLLKTTMKRLLPPPPLAQTRIFTTKDLKANTRRQYQQLPEFRQKQDLERENRIRKSQRIIADLFNKNLQKRVLRGKTDLSNSMMVN